MDTLLGEICGSYRQIYDNIHLKNNPTNEKLIPHLPIINLLKSSSLSEEILAQVWEQCDGLKNGYFSKESFYQMLKLVALAQSGLDPLLKNMKIDCNPPFFKDSTDLTLKNEDIQKYTELYKKLSPVDGHIPLNTLLIKLQDFKLPTDIFKKIFFLCNLGKSSEKVSFDTFCRVIHLTLRCMNGISLPEELPRSMKSPETVRSNVNGGLSISSEEQNLYKKHFDELDVSKMGKLSGNQLVGIFTSSGLNQTQLFNIWQMSDYKAKGYLTANEFALSMTLIKIMKMNKEIPLEEVKKYHEMGAKNSIAIPDGLKLNKVHEASYKDLEELNSKNNSLLNEINSKEHEIHDLKDKNKILEDEVMKINRKNMELEQNICSLKVQIGQLNSNKEQALNDANELKQQSIKMHEGLKSSNEKMVALENEIKDLKIKLSDCTKIIDETNHNLINEKQQNQKLKKELDQLNSQLKSQGKTPVENVEISNDTTSPKTDKDNKKKTLRKTDEFSNLYNDDNDPFSTAHCKKFDDLKSANNVAPSSLFSAPLKSDTANTDLFSMFPASNTNKSTGTKSLFDTNDSFKQEAVNVDPFNAKGLHDVDPFSSMTKTTDSFKQMNVDPFKKTEANTDPFNMSDVSFDPFKKVGANIDPFKQNNIKSNPFGTNNSSSDPFSKTDANDPFASSTTANFSSTSKNTANNDPFSF